MKNYALTEHPYTGWKLSGFTMIALQLILLIAALAAIKIIFNFQAVFISIIVIMIDLLLVGGYIMNEPNDARVLIFFGKYAGTLKTNGFYWVNPLYKKVRLTQRARNLDVEPIKVNDKAGNPIMIGLVLVWRIKDTYKAMFDVDCPTASPTIGAPGTPSTVGTPAKQLRMNAFQAFVSIQSDSALRNIAAEYAYDNNDHPEEITLRSGGQEVADKLEKELNTRLDIAGIEVVEARINYLAYAPEIAAVMLRRQQASAIISAREKIVEGAVSMVRMALDKIKEEEVVELDEEKKAAMVSNLLVVLCSDEQAQPIINTGSLYH